MNPGQAQKRLYDRSLASYGLKLCGIAPKSFPNDGVVLFSVVRNEQLRLPYFLDYYSGLGVAGLVVVDHGSTDGTAEILDRHPLVMRYETSQGFDRKEAWIDLLLHRHGMERWCLVVDVDEILRYPHDNEVSLADLCAHMEITGASAMQTILLDMYSRGPLRDCDYTQGADPLAVCPYFDSGPYTPSRQWVPRDLFLSDELHDAAVYGGVRARLFDLPSICISKYPLFRFGPGSYAGRGCHFVEGIRPTRIRGSLLHFKFLQDFPEKVGAALKERQYAGESADYEKYSRALQRADRIVFHADVSMKFQGSAQLVDCAIMRDTPEFSRFAAGRNPSARKEFCLP